MDEEKQLNQYELIEFYRQNPCIAASDILKVDLAPHQRIVLKGMWESNYSILCLSRGTGKSWMLSLFSVLRAILYPGERVGIIGPSYRQCLNKNGLTPIFTNKGMFMPQDFLDHVNVGQDEIQSINDSNTVVNKWLNEKSNGLTINTDGMFDFSAKLGHLVLTSTKDGLCYKKIEDLERNETLPIRIGFNLFGSETKLPTYRYTGNKYTKDVKIPTEMSIELAYFLGLIVGDGCITKKKNNRGCRVCFITSDDQLVDLFSNLTKRLFGINCTVNKKSNTTYNLVINSKKIYDFLQLCGLKNCGALKKSVPSIIKKAPKEFVASFLSGLFDTDGYVCQNMNMVGLSTSSLILANEVRAILLNLGVFAKVAISVKSHKYNINGNTGYCSDNYSIRITSLKYIEKFNNEVGFKLNRKQEVLSSYNYDSNCKWSDRLVTPKNIIKNIRKFLINKYGAKKGAGILYKNLGQVGKHITPERLKKCLEDIYEYCYECNDYKNLVNMFSAEYAFVRIKSIKPVECETFDIEVDNESCYWAGGLIHHNSKLVFSEIEKLYEQSPDFREATIKPPIKAPESCWVKFVAGENKVGSLIECLPLGDGSRIRGTRYFTIVCDEFAQIPEEILDVVVRGMMATEKNPMEQVRRIQRERKLIKEGKLDHITKSKHHKLVFASTAFFQYNHFWKRIQGFLDIFEKKKREMRKLKAEGKKVPDNVRIICRGSSPNGGLIPHRFIQDDERCLAAFTCEDPPEGFMNRSSIEEAKREMSEYLYLMEYYAFFPADSNGFFPRSVLDKAREHRQFPCVLEGNKNPDEVFIMGIDPARSGDNFVVAIVRVNIKTGTIDLVRVLAYNNKEFPLMHREIRSLIKLYNISEIAMDSGGGGTTIRDLLADRDACPVGEDLILQRDYEEHDYIKGKRILELVNFSKYDLIHDANHDMLSNLQHGIFRFASSPNLISNLKGDIITLEIADEEIIKTVEEMQNIVVTITGAGRMHWDTPMKGQKKDRYSATMLAHYMADSYLKSLNRPVELATGFWG